MRLDLDIDLGAAARPGRRAAALEAEEVRAVSAADLGLLAVAGRGTKPAEIKKITDRHHMLARLVAAGTPQGEAAAICGYTDSRASIILGSPAGKELISLYRGEVNAEYAVIINHMQGIAKDSLVEIRDRFESEPESFSNKELRELADTMLDRVGHPKKKEIDQTVNVNLAERLEKARQRARSFIDNADVIEAEIIEEGD